MVPVSPLGEMVSYRGYGATCGFIMFQDVTPYHRAHRMTERMRINHSVPQTQDGFLFKGIYFESFQVSDEFPGAVL